LQFLLTFRAVFYSFTGLALWALVPGALGGLWIPAVLFIVVLVSRTTFELTKYGRVAAYPLWSSKLVGSLGVTALAVTFATGRSTPLLALAIWAGIGNELEGFVASAILPACRSDVPSLLHTLRGR
jgi:hypothetical protein